jgi:hypothetical protein
MAMVLMEGFDHLQASLFTAKGWSANPTSVQAGRINGNCIRLGASLVRTKALPSSYATLYTGFAFRFASFSAAVNVFALRAGATNTMQIQLSSLGKLVILNSSSTVIATGTTVLNPNTWYYIEVKAFINGASGTCELHLNGAAEITSTTGNFGSTNLDNVGPIPGASGNNFDYDDLYVCDSTGSGPTNTFLGDFHVDTLFPSADGAHTDYTPSAAGSHFNKANEHSGTFPDDDTTYVSDATVGHRDSYAFDDLPIVAGTIFAIQTNLYARKDDAAVRQVAPVTRPVATDRDGATVTLGLTYTDFTEIRETNPDTAAAWTISDVNGSEFGVKTVA